jgi:pimeloyl-ACP methyl ester carboxylesterase
MKFMSKFLKTTVNELTHLATELSAIGVEAVTAIPRFMLGMKGLPSLKGKVIVLIPGYTASKYTLSYLFLFLKKLGATVELWEGGDKLLGANFPRANDVFMKKLLDPTVAQIKRLHKTHGQKVYLIGHSLGGVIAPILAKRLGGHIVAGIISLGSPNGFSDGDSEVLHVLHVASEAVVGLIGDTSPEYEAEGSLFAAVEKHAGVNDYPDDVPWAALIAGSDGIVTSGGGIPEKAKRDNIAQREHVVTGASHCGVGALNYDSFKAIAHLLSVPSQTWETVCL